MLTYLVRRLALAIPTLLGLSLLVFLLVALAPGGVGAILDQPGVMLEGSQHAMRLQYLEERYGLNDPVLTQYARWLGRVSPLKFGSPPTETGGIQIIPRVLWFGAPDLGQSFSRNRPVGDLIAEALPITLLLNGISLMLTCLISIPAGAMTACRRGTIVDRSLQILLLGLWSIPIVWASVLLLGLLAGPSGLGIFPLGGITSDAAREMRFLPSIDAADGFRAGWMLDSLWHLVLPVTCLTYGGLAILTRQTRAAVLEHLHSDYVRTARAKGASGTRVIMSHVLRNSLLPILTMLGGLLPATLSGSLIVERVFNIPGMGTLIVDAIFLRDREILLANTLIIGVVTIGSMLVTDLLYACADPRIRFSGIEQLRGSDT